MKKTSENKSQPQKPIKKGFGVPPIHEKPIAKPEGTDNNNGNRKQ